MRQWLVFASSAVLLFTNASLAEIRPQSTLRVAIDPALGAIYFYADFESRQYAGFEWDVLQAIATHLDISIDPIYVPWGGQLNALTEERVDLVIGAREPFGLDPAQFSATVPYYLSPQRLVVGQGNTNTINTLSDLFGRKVGTVVNSTGAALLEVYNANRGNAIRLFATSDPARLFSQLREGQLDAIVIDQPVAVASLNQYPDTFSLVGEPLVPTPLVGVVAADRDDLKLALDSAILALEEDGTLAQIREQWQL